MISKAPLVEVPDPDDGPVQMMVYVGEPPMISIQIQLY